MCIRDSNVVGQNALSTLNLVVGIVVAMLVAMVLLGGIKRIGSVSERLVPFMACLLYTSHSSKASHRWLERTQQG